MEPETVTPAEPASAVRYFVPTQSCGGLVAAVGILFVAGVGALTTLPGSPVAAVYPPWLTWTLRLAPLPFILLLWAVMSEAEFRIKTDATAIGFRRGLGSVTRVPWREMHDFFADCGRGLAEVAESGGSLVDEPAATDDGIAAEAAPTKESAPFAEYRPDHMLVSERGMFVFDDTLARLQVLTAEVVAHAPPEAPARWEEASWVACPACRQRLAVSLWPWVHGVEAPQPPRCPTCDASLAPLLAGVVGPFIVEVRGTERRRFAWYLRAEPSAETPEEPAAEEPADETE